MRKRQAAQAKPQSVIIFVTGFMEHMQDAFDVNAFHYLLKPIKPDKFESVFQKAIQELSGTWANTYKHIFIQSKDMSRRIFHKDILFIESSNKKVRINCSDGTIEYYATMDEMERLLGNAFFRCHRCYLVNMEHVARYNASFLFFRVSMPVRVFMTCCFWSVKEICLFIAYGPQAVVDNIFMGISAHVIDSRTTSESIQWLLDIHAIAREGVLAVTHMVFLLLFLRYVTKSFTYKNYALRQTEIFFLLFPCLSSIVVTQILRQVLVLSYKTTIDVLNNNTLTIFLIPTAGIILLFSMVASVKSYQSLIRLHMEKTEKRVLEKQMIQIKEQVQDVQDVYADIRGIRHDMANHLSNIRLLIQSDMDNQEELDGYIGKLEDGLDALRFDCQTGNPITDVIIHQKMLEARNKGIVFESDFLFPETLDIDSVDIAVILSNGLDNALEACCSIPDGGGNHYINLSAYKKGVMFFIEIENSFCGTLIFDENTGLPVSGKTDGEPHGIGLTNIKRCAGKYFGDINITYDGRLFHLTVMLQGWV